MTLNGAIAGRAALYARGSADGQTNSIPGQLERLRALAAARGLPVAGEYADGGMSAGAMPRAGLRRLIADGKEGRFDVLLVDSLDRLARDRPEDVLSPLRRAGVQVVTAIECGDPQVMT
jgi:site-specific DNA recombinase